MKSITTEDKPVEQAAAARLSDEVPAEAAVRDAWTRLCDVLKGNQRLHIALTGARLEFAEEAGKLIVTYYVANAALKSWLEERNSRMENKLRELCGSSRIDLAVRETEDETPHVVAISPLEKANEMIEKNPKVGQIVSDLGLEIK